jgi:DNA-binding NarL/FixJ family response regulator
MEAGSAQAGGTMRILVVEDETTLAEALAAIIDLQPDLECIGTVSTLAEALTTTRTERPDVVLMDVRLPDGDGIDGTAALLAISPETRVLILTADDRPATVGRAATAGATSFLLKNSPLPTILHAIRTTQQGGMFVESNALDSVMRRMTESGVEGSAIALAASLTEREIEVLLLMGHGLDPAAIAARLSVSIHTARGHVKNIMMKLGTHTQLEAVVRARRVGLID